MTRARTAAARLAPALAAIALWASPAPAQPPADCSAAQILVRQTLTPVGSAQRHVEAADLNGDGLADLVVSTPTSLIIALATGVSSGQVSYEVSFVYAGYPDATGSAIADFDGDGINDLALACDGGGVFLFRGLGSNGTGNGQFSRYLVLDVGSAWDVASADLNGDGIRDLVIALRSGGVASYLGDGTSGHGDGTFTAGSTTVTAGSCKGLALADMDQDGILDVVVAGENSTVGVLKGGGTLGVGSGNFTLAKTLNAAGSTFDVTVEDFDGNGIPDVASANYTGNSFTVFLGQPDFTFQGGLTHSSPGVPLGIEAADFNLDGRPDLVVATGSSGSSFAYIPNVGSSTPNADGFSGAVPFGLTRGSYGISVADLNGDHSLDVLVPGVFESSVLAAFNSCFGGTRRLTINIVGLGSVARLPDLPAYDPGTVVQLTAVPDEGQVFDHWSGDVTGSANPSTVTMDFDRRVTATFVPRQQTITITLAGAGQGSVARSPALPTYPLGSTVRLTAVPDFESVFAEWSGDATGSVNPLDLLVDGDKSVTATFDRDATLSPHILSVTDVPLDQGGKVKLRWRPSALETTTTDPDRRVTQYYLWREIPQAAIRSARAIGPQAGTGAATPSLRTAAATREYFWEFVAALPAARFTGYSYTAATTNDSTVHGNPFTAFLVQARNAAATRWFDSDPDSGYSVDNLSPPTPGPLVARFGATGNSFHWGPSHAPDLAGYRLHRGADRDFAPSAVNLIAELGDTAYFDPSPTSSYYKLAAVDVHGNRSHFVLVSPEGPVGTLASLVTAEASADRIRLRWFVNQPGLAVTVYRRTLDTDWLSLSSLFADGRGFIAYEDASVTRGVTYGYRLGIQEAGLEAFYAETYVLAEDLRFALEAPVPNPARGGRMSVRLVLPSAEAATLELLDVAGRRVDQRLLAGLLGRQSVELGSGTRIRPGLYWLRLRQHGLERSLRAVVLD